MGRPILLKTYLDLCEHIGKHTERTPEGCILWTGHKRHGYGDIRWKGKAWRAHMLVLNLEYEKLNKPIPAGKQVNHRCDNRHCINPEHLYFGTQADNISDLWARGVKTSDGSRRRPMGRSKLKEADVIEIRKLASTHPHAELAKRFGVSRTRICEAASGKTWSHVKSLPAGENPAAQHVPVESVNTSERTC